jgi:hypothetical protein
LCKTGSIYAKAIRRNIFVISLEEPILFELLWCRLDSLGMNRFISNCVLQEEARNLEKFLKFFILYFLYKIKKEKERRKEEKERRKAEEGKRRKGEGRRKKEEKYN